jgi:prevent-host-death family protein
MRTVNIGVLKNQLSAYLQLVRKGEEIVVRDRNKPVARILPFTLPLPPEGDHEAEVAYLIATGQMKEAKQEEMDWEAFWALPAGNVPHDIAVQALIDSRGDR